MTADESIGDGRDEAAALYDEAYARRYRDRDDELQEARHESGADRLARQRVRSIRSCRSTCSISGCGTGRYFWGLRQRRAR